MQLYMRDSSRRETSEIQEETASACFLWTPLSASIPSGNYLKILCLRLADHIRFWGVGVGLFLGSKEGKVATLSVVF